MGVSKTTSAQSTDCTGSYYINNHNDTLFGKIKLEKNSQSFSFLMNDTWVSKKIEASDAKTFCKSGAYFQKETYKGRTVYLQCLGEEVYQYHYKKERFYDYLVSNDISWPNNNHPEMRYKYKVIHYDKTIYINRFNYRSVLKYQVGMTPELVDNCHFYEFALDSKSIFK